MGTIVFAFALFRVNSNKTCMSFRCRDSNPTSRFWPSQVEENEKSRCVGDGGEVQIDAPGEAQVGRQTVLPKLGLLAVVSIVRPNYVDVSREVCMSVRGRLTVSAGMRA